MNVFNKLIRNNEFPIIFIGSGISKRYLIDSPTWLELLENLWNKTFNNDEFYARMLQVKHSIQEKYIDEKELEFNLNIKISSEIEKKFIEDFTMKDIEVEGLTRQRVFLEKINPFKYYLAKQFEKVETNNKYEEEKESFQKMLNKARIVLTTNYDTFIEKVYSESENKITVYIGQRGLFKPNLGYSELFKIHGCCTDEKSLVLTEEDYKSIEKNLSLISAKITSELLLSPIIFLGYSLSDINIRKIIQNFVDSLSESEKKELEERIIFIEWKKDQKDLKIETILEFGIRITVVITDNYEKIYNEISKIDQGISPWEISKYKFLIRKVILNQRENTSSDILLIEAKKLEEICSDDLKDKKIAVSLVESIESVPDLKTYLKTILEDREYKDIENKLRYIAMITKGTSGYFPIFKYLNNLESLEKYNLNKTEVEKLKAVYENQILNIKKMKTNRKEYETISEIKYNTSSDYKFYDLVIKNFKNLELEDVRKFLLEELQKENFEFKTDLRRVFLLYDNSIHNK